MLHDEQGVYDNLLRELQLEGSFRNYLRMMKEQCYDLVERITPVLQCTNTNFGAAVTPAERLAVNMRYLATGMGYLFFVMENAVIISAMPRGRQKMISREGLTCLGSPTPGPLSSPPCRKATPLNSARVWAHPRSEI